MAVLDAADRHPIDFHSLRWPALKVAAEALGRASLASGAASEAGAVRFLATDSLRPPPLPNSSGFRHLRNGLPRRCRSFARPRF
jgi:hypothetical protein